VTDLKMEVYKTIFQTWRDEVDSYWQRNSYFAAFETALLAACWYVVDHAHIWSGLAFAVLGFVSALIWLLTSVAVHRYIDYWWRSIKEIEDKLPLKDEGLNFATKHPGSGMHPSLLVHMTPVLFAVGWVVIFLFALHCLCPGIVCSSGHA
jgi:hypothetical protein